MRTPCAFAFINHGDVHITTSLLPPQDRARNLKDILDFDPEDDMLSLCYITTDKQLKDQMGLVSVPGVVFWSLSNTFGTPVWNSG
jgi:hypothetical protein